MTISTRIGVWWWALALGSCAGPPAPGAGGGPRVAIDVAALNLTGVGDVVWDVEVVNGRAPTPEVIWQRRISSSSYGDGAGSASYVGPCDADPAVDENTVRVWVVGVFAGPVTAAGSFGAGAPNGVSGVVLPFENPTVSGPLTREVVCAPNADASVRFDVALMRPAQQGFFDVAVNFNNIFCSAKFDCCVEDAAGAACDRDIALLAGADGERSSTMVLGFACTAGTAVGVETELYLDALALDCTSPTSFSAGFGADFVIDPSGPGGNQCAAGQVGGGDCSPRVSAPTGLDADAYLYQVAIYRGLEQLQGGAGAAHKVYWNVALGVVREAAGGVGIEDCWLRARGTAADANGQGGVGDGAIAAGVVYPYVRWEVKLGACGAEALTFGDPAAMVRTDYTRTSDPVTAFGFGYGPHLGPGTFCTLPCEHGTCVAGVCACEAGYSGATCGTSDGACVAGACGEGTGAGTCVAGAGGFSCLCSDGYFGDGTTSCTACDAVAGCTAVTCAAAGASACTACAPGLSLSGGACVAGEGCGVLGVACPAGFACLAGGCVSDGTASAAGPSGSTVYVPAGTFWMGCDGALDPACPADAPQHEVALSPYTVDLREVSAAEYAAWCAGAPTVPGDAEGCVPKVRQGSVDDWGDATYAPEIGVGTKLDHPVNYVSHAQAAAYCVAQGRRLCTEAEWERAARGGCETVVGSCAAAMRTYPWGSAAPSCTEANFSYDGNNLCEDELWTAPTASRSAGASPYGAVNLAGNASEWTADRRGAYPTAGVATDPTGPKLGTDWVHRGGPYWGTAAEIRADARWSAAATYASGDIGFRCCAPYGPCERDGTLCGADAGQGTCHDTPTGFRCECAAGFAWDGASACTPCGGGCPPATCGAFGLSCPLHFVCNTALAEGTNYDAFCAGDGTMPATFGAVDEMVYVPAGTLWMGCNQQTDTYCAVPSAYLEEKPQREVIVSAYAIDRLEVTAAEYSACATFGGCSSPRLFWDDGRTPTNPTTVLAGHEQYPVNFVTWAQAGEYCAWRGKRLCTEAEWERAARGGCETVEAPCQSTMRKWPWDGAAGAPAGDPGCYTLDAGNVDLFGLLPCSGAGDIRTYPVGSFVASTSPYGAQSMVGNAQEWVADWWVSYPGTTERYYDGTGEARVVRGAFYIDNPQSLARTTHRYPVPPADSNDWLGFRCCQTY